MKNKYLIGIGVIALGVFAYSRYAKKDDSGQAEDPNTGGGGIGGGIGGGGIPNLPTPPIPPTPPTNPVVTARVGVTPTTRGTVVVAAPTTQMNNPLQSGITRSGISGTGMNTGGITGAGTGTGTSATSSTINVKDNTGVFKPFSGCEPNGRRPIFLNDLVRSWNRP
jgi:hypothetical protein